MNKYSILVLLLLPFSVWAEEVFEEVVSQPVERYEMIWEVSPFVAVTDLSGQVDNLNGRYAITGIARVADQAVVFFFDRTTLERFSLEPGKSRGNLSLESVTGLSDIKTARVTIGSGTGPLVLSYDPAVLPAPAPVAPPQAQAAPGRRRSQPEEPQAVTQPSTNQIVGNTAQPTPTPRRLIRRSRGIVAPQ